MGTDQPKDRADAHAPFVASPHLAEGLTPPRPRLPYFRSSNFASLMLILLTTFWGLSFSLMKMFQTAAFSVPVPESMLFGPVLVVALSTIVLRAGLAIPLLVLTCPQLLVRPTRRAHVCGAVLGTVFGIGFTMGVSGLSVISPARSAFLINLTCVFVPIMGWLMFGVRPTRWLVAGLVVCLSGVVVLTGGAVGADAGINWGDAVTIGSSVMFALQVVLLDYFGRFEPSRNFTFGFIGTTALVTGVGVGVGMTFGDGFSAWTGWLVTVCQLPNVPWVVAGMAMTTALSLSLMSTYQPRVGANRAALIYLLEIVFSAIFGIAFGYDVLTWALMLSGGLILVGNLIVELPAFLRR